MTGQNPQLLTDVGLADHAAGADFLHCDKGPDGSPGVVCAWQRPGATGIGYQPARQEWFPAVPAVSDQRSAVSGQLASSRGELLANRYWVGTWNNSPPTPADLVLPQQCVGHRVTLGDGHPWLIADPGQLPKSLILDGYGRWVSEVPPEWRELWTEYRRQREFLATVKDDTTFSFGDLADYVVRILRVNYRLAVEVVDRLRLLSEANVMKAYLAAAGGQSAMQEPTL